MNGGAFRGRFVQGLGFHFDRRIPSIRSFTADVDGLRFEVTVIGCPSLAFGYRFCDYVVVKITNLGCCLSVRARSYISPDYVARECNMTDAEARAFITALVRRCPELMLRTDRELIG